MLPKPNKPFKLAKHLDKLLAKPTKLLLKLVSLSLEANDLVFGSIFKVDKLVWKATWF